MTPRRRNAVVRGELDALLREGLLSPAGHARLATVYPVTRWDWRALARWFLALGAVTTAAGAVILGQALFVFTLEKLAIGLTLATAVPLLAARALLRRHPPWTMSARALELLSGFALIALSLTLGALYGGGSGNWPALLGIDLAILLALSYALRNPLLLALSSVVFFCWFGGFTGFASGWNAYWFGMSYPLRFLIAAAFIVAAGVVHLRAEASWPRQRGFAAIWISSGVFFGEMALWLMSLFGNFDLESSWHRAGPGELLLFNLLWAALNVALMLFGRRTGMRMLIGYGATFGVIQIYTAFFAHLAGHLGGVLSLLVSGGMALAGVLWLERRRRPSPAPRARPPESSSRAS